jgi:3-dehydroquinate synthase II
LPHDKPVVIRTADWTIIPLENLLAQRRNIFLEVATLEAALTASGILEKGVDGIIISAADPLEVRKIAAALKQQEEKLGLVEATVTRVFPLPMGDRVCIDTCTTMSVGQGMLIGNSSGGMFLVHSESIENPYVEPRPFRVNAGPVHAYVRVPGNKTRYLSELRSGDPTLIVDHTGATQAAVVGRIKSERRPLVFVEAVAGDQPYTVILQNAETIRLTAPGGRPVSVVELREGSTVLMFIEKAGRHFGMKIDETIDEK